MSKIKSSTTIANVIEIQHGHPMVSSLRFAEIFERNHKDVLRTIRKEFSEEIDRRNLAPINYIDAGGRTQPIFWLNERQALFVMPFIGGRRAREGQRKLVDAYLYYRSAYSNPPRKTLIAEKRSAHRKMMDALIDARAEAGKETSQHNFMVENKLCNFVLSGNFSAIDESAMSNGELELLEKIRRRNESMLMCGLEYQDRKNRLIAFAARDRVAISA